MNHDGGGMAQRGMIPRLPVLDARVGLFGR